MSTFLYMEVQSMDIKWLDQAHGLNGKARIKTQVFIQ